LNDSFKLLSRALSTSLIWSLASFLAKRFSADAPEYEKEGIKAALEITSGAYLRRKPVIWTNTFFPTELIYGLGALPFMPEVASGFAAALKLSPSFLKEAQKKLLKDDLCSFHRTSYGLMLKKLFPAPDAVVINSLLCDGEKNFFSLAAQELKVPFYLIEVPYKKEENNIRVVEEQLKTTTASLLNTIPELNLKNLDSALFFSNEANRALAKVEKLRENEPVPWPGEKALNWVALFFLLFGSEEGVKFYDALAQELEENKDNSSKEERFRLLWLHFRPYYSNDFFHFLKEKGAEIAFDEYHYLYWPELDYGNPYKSLALKMISHPGWGSIVNRLNNLEYLGRRFKINGIIQFGQIACAQSNGSRYILEEFFAKKEIPFLQIDADALDPQNYFYQQNITRLEAFVELLERKKNVSMRYGHRLDHY